MYAAHVDTGVPVLGFPSICPVNAGYGRDEHPTMGVAMSRFRVSMLLPVVLLAQLMTFVASVASAQLVISEFRLRGSNGANDEFIESTITPVPLTQSPAAEPGTGSRLPME